MKMEIESAGCDGNLKEMQNRKQEVEVNEEVNRKWIELLEII